METQFNRNNDCGLTRGRVAVGSVAVEGRGALLDLLDLLELFSNLGMHRKSSTSSSSGSILAAVHVVHTHTRGDGLVSVTGTAAGTVESDVLGLGACPVCG